MATLATALLQRKSEPDDEQLIKLFWNRAELKQELGRLRREKEKLTDQLKQQETTNLRLQQKFESLENLLADPLQAANAVIYYQLRAVWQGCRKRLVRLSRDLTERQRTREHQHVLAAFERQRQEGLAVLDEKLAPFLERQRQIEGDLRVAETRLAQLAGFWNYFRRRPFHDQAETIRASLEGLRTQIDRQVAHRREKEAEPAPTPEGLSVEGRRNINLAVIALAQQMLLTLGEQNVAGLARDAAVRSLTDVAYGSAEECQRLSLVLQAVVDKLDEPDKAIGSARRRAEYLKRTALYRRDSDTVPLATSFAAIPLSLAETGEPRPTVDRSLPVNVMGEDYWDVCAVLLT